MRAIPLLLVALMALSAILSNGQGQGLAQVGSLVLTPSSGLVGTTVSISGSGCSNPGQATYLTFQGGFDLSGTPGALDIPNIPTDPSGTFTTTFEIPSEVGNYQGMGGGAVVPGRYQFVSHPPICIEYFTVTGPGSLPQTGGEPASSSHGWESIPPTLLIGPLLVALGIPVLAIAGRLRRR